MAGIGIALVWVSYTFGLYGYCLIKGYNLSFKQLFSTSWPPSGTGGSQPGEGDDGKRNVAPGPNTPKPGFGGL